jgi:predicted kinase
VSGLELLPLFLSCRAGVRAKTSASAARVQTGDPKERRRLEQAARDYLEMADALLSPAPPSLTAIGGLSGTGKSTVAQAIAPRLGAAPGALVLRSDEIRKALCGVGRLDPLGPDGYTEATTARVYRAIAERAAAALTAGRAVVADAVFAREDDRKTIERVAGDAGVPFRGIWLTAPEPVLVERVAARTDDPSDATAEVVRSQVAHTVAPTRWRVVNATGALADIVDRVAGLAGGGRTAGGPG